MTVYLLSLNVSKNPREKRPQKFEFRGIIETNQTTALLISDRTLRSALKTEGDLLSLNFQ